MEKTFKIDGMSCGHCVIAVKKELIKANIQSHKVEIGFVTIDVEKNNISTEVVVKAIENAGYKVINTK